MPIILRDDLALAIALVSRWVCAAMACAKCEGQFEANLIKNARGRLYYLLICPASDFFFKVTAVRSRSIVPVGNLC